MRLRNSRATTSVTPSVSEGPGGAGGAPPLPPGPSLTLGMTNPLSLSFQPTGARVVAPSQISAANGKIVVADRYALRVFGPDSAPPSPPPAAGKRRAAHR